jgi:RND superfamily putative drug exporter
MTALLTFATGRKAKFAVLVAWLLVAAAVGPFAGKLEEATENDQVSFLPGDAESVRVLEAAEEFPSGELTPAVVVYQREGGLTAADRRAIDTDRAAAARGDAPGLRPATEVVVSPDGTTALFAVPIAAEGDADILVEATEHVRAAVAGPPDGLTVKVTGPAGFATDAIDVFDGIDTELLIAAASLVFVLLILIYRSPIFWAIPFFAVVFAETAARAMGYGLTELGVTVDGQSAAIMTVLVFGAGTDYALLLVARYREELRHHADPHDAIRRAVRRAGPAIVASGLTVIAGLLCLTLAELNSTSALGPIGALGILLALLSMLTLLPALLALCGRRAFWPFIPHVGDEGTGETHGFWRRLGERIGAGPRRVWVGALVVLAVMCLGLTQMNDDLTSGNGFRGGVESVEGQELLAGALPAGATAPTTVLVRDRERVEDVRAALERADGVAALGEVETGPPGARFDVVLSADPYSQAAFGLIPKLREVVHEAGGEGALVGGPSAEEYDVRQSVQRDTALILPLILLVVLAILCGLLRALVAPLLLIATVIVSFASALGVGAVLFEQVLGYPGIEPSLPLFAFVFLVALGIDYNIFLMARVREEARRHGTAEGMRRGLAVTGAVITSAGIVLAGTFCVLVVLPLYALTEIGFTIAFGVLLDTLLVRSVLVPALVLDAGPRVWWPSALARRREPVEAQAAGS